jgi:hypothetical protein
MGRYRSQDYFGAKPVNNGPLFKSEEEKAINQVGVTAQYKQLVGQYTTLPFVKVPALDVDNYMVGKA